MTDAAAIRRRIMPLIFLGMAFSAFSASATMTRSMSSARHAGTARYADGKLARSRYAGRGAGIRCLVSHDASKRGEAMPR